MKIPTPMSIIAIPIVHRLPSLDATYALLKSATTIETLLATWSCPPDAIPPSSSGKSSSRAIVTSTIGMTSELHAYAQNAKKPA